MLQLKVNSEIIDLGPSPQITIDEESPVFDKDSIPGAFAFPFDVPITDRNRRIFQFPERIEKSGPMIVTQAFELYHGGLQRACGTIHVKEADDATYRAYLTVASGDFASKIQGKKLKDLNLGGERTWVHKSEFRYPEDDFAIFPVYNPDFMKDSYMETSFKQGDCKINYFENGAFLEAAYYTFSFIPFPFVAYIIRQLFADFGFQIIENCFESDPDLRDLVIYSTQDIFSLVQSTELIEVNLGFDQYGQPLSEFQEVSTVTRGLDKFDLKNSMPDITIKEFILALRNRFNLGFVIDRYNRVKIIKRQDLVMLSKTVDISSLALGSPKVSSVDPPAGFALKWEHDPDDALFSEELFKEIDNFLEYLKDPVASTSELTLLSPEINEIRLVESLGIYYRYAKFELPAGGWRYQWQQWSTDFQNYLEGEMEEVFTSSISTIQMVNRQWNLSGPSFRCPWIRQPGNFMEREERQPFSLRLVFYRGMQLDSQGNPYPMGSNDNLDRTGNQITGKNLAMKWQGEFGIYQKLWKDYLSWWLNRKQVNWSILDPSSLDFNQKYAIDRNQYLLKKRSIHFELYEIIPGECEWFLV